MPNAYLNAAQIGVWHFLCKFCAQIHVAGAQDTVLVYQIHRFRQVGQRYGCMPCVRGISGNLFPHSILHSIRMQHLLMRLVFHIVLYIFSLPETRRIYTKNWGILKKTCRSLYVEYGMPFSIAHSSAIPQSTFKIPSKQLIQRHMEYTKLNVYNK